MLQQLSETDLNCRIYLTDYSLPSSAKKPQISPEEMSLALNEASNSNDDCVEKKDEIEIETECPNEDSPFLSTSDSQQFPLLTGQTHEKLECKICNKQFENVHRLQRHIMSHDESPELRKFKCDFCNKAFKFKHHLKVY